MWDLKCEDRPPTPKTFNVQRLTFNVSFLLLGGSGFAGDEDAFAG